MQDTQVMNNIVDTIALPSSLSSGRKKISKPPIVVEKSIGFIVANHQDVVRELNWNQKIGRNVIGQKSELEKVFLKRKVKPPCLEGAGGDVRESFQENNDKSNDTNLPQEFRNKFISIKGNFYNDSFKERDREPDNINAPSSEFLKIYAKVVTKGDLDCSGTDIHPISAL